MSSFTDQKPRVATTDEVGGEWGAAPNGERFRCYLCGHRFAVGDIWRFVAMPDTINILVCEGCDGPDVRERWRVHLQDAKQRFWWMRRRP